MEDNDWMVFVSPCTCLNLTGCSPVKFFPSKLGKPFLYRAALHFLMLKQERTKQPVESKLAGTLWSKISLYDVVLRFPSLELRGPKQEKKNKTPDQKYISLCGQYVANPGIIQEANSWPDRVINRPYLRHVNILGTEMWNYWGGKGSWIWISIIKIFFSP